LKTSIYFSLIKAKNGGIQMKRLIPLILLVAAGIFFVSNSQIISEKLDSTDENEINALELKQDSVNSPLVSL